MSITSTYLNKEIRIKGNQLIFWTKDLMKEVLKTPHREEKIAQAIDTKKAVVKKPEDWLSYEGMFESMQGYSCCRSDWLMRQGVGRIDATYKRFIS